jgi:transcriptional regulator with XRE-family HTH domain
MRKKETPLRHATADLLREFGERLRLARRRRGVSAKLMAQRAGMAPMTLRAVERGSSVVTIGAYIAVMQLMGMEREIGTLASDDEIGRRLQDGKLAPRKRSPIDP